MTGTRISEQKAFSQLRRLSRVWRHMSWLFPGEYGEKWEHWAITNKLDSKIERERERERERDTEFLYNMLSSLFSLIKEKAEVSMTSSESVDSSYYAAIRQFITNNIQQHQRLVRHLFSFSNFTTKLWYHLLSTSHLTIPSNQFLI